MSSKPIIRLIKESEVDQLVHLCEQHAQFEKAHYSKDEKESNLKNHLFGDQPALFCLIVSMDEKLIGYATYMKQFSTWDAEFYIYMDCLFMTEDARGFGIGELLIDQIKEEAKRLGCNLIQWQTPDFNLRAMKFYDRIGAVSTSKERYFLTVD